MNLLNLIPNIHWLPVSVMTFISFFPGAIWHSPFLFGKIWKRENNYDLTQKRVSYPLIFGGTAVLHLLAIAGLSALGAGMGFLTGMINGILITLIWIIPAMAGTYLFANRSLKLLAIDAGMYLVLFPVSGGILGIW